MSKNIQAFLKNHPALLVSSCYFVTTAIGIVYSFIFYHEFGINILNFSDVGEFLLVSIIKPISIVIFLSAVIFVILIAKVDYFFRKRVSIYGNAIEKIFKPKYSDLIIHVVTVLVVAIVYINALAKADAERIKAGEFSEYELNYLSNDSMIQNEVLAFLGGSSRYNYFYNPKEINTIIISASNTFKVAKKLK